MAPLVRLRPTALSNSRLTASTLVEVLVAMVVVMIIFSLAMGIVLKVTTSAPSLFRQQANLNIQQILIDSEVSDQPEKEEIMIDSILYIKTVMPYGHYHDLQQIQVTAQKDGTTLARLIRIIPISHEKAP